MSLSAPRHVGLGLLALAAILLVALGGDATPSSAALPAPTLTSPASDTRLTDFSVILAWQLPVGTTQYHSQVVPAQNDGPGVDLIRSTASSFTIPAPPAWYGLLPDMTYSWRVRASDKPTFAPSDDPSWGPWSTAWTFRTPVVSSEGATAVSPAQGTRLATPDPVALTWHHPKSALFYFEVQVSADPGFSTDPATATAPVWWNLVHAGVSTPPNSWTTPPLEVGTTYYWRVRPRVQGDGTPVPWSSTFTFSVSYGAYARIASVVDGDTLDVQLDSGQERLRLIGIDTPEVYGGVQCFGPEASAFTASLVPPGTLSRLEKDVSEQDRYQRLLRYAYLPDGRMLNEVLVAEGYATVATFPPDVRYQDRFLEAERRAREQAKGLWGNCQQAPSPTPTPTPTPTPEPAPAPSNCDPSYPTVCIPPPPPDLDCGDIPYRNFPVNPPDPHRFDGDKDGVGCET